MLVRYAFCSPKWQLLYYRGPPWTNWRPLHDAGHMRCVCSPSLSLFLPPHTHLFFRIFSVFFPRQFAAKVELWAAFHCFKSPSKFRFPIPVAFTVQVAVPAPVLVAVQVLVAHSESLTHSLPWRFKMLAIKCKIIEFLIDSIDAAHSVRFFLIHCNWGQFNCRKVSDIFKKVKVKYRYCYYKAF